MKIRITLKDGREMNAELYAEHAPVTVAHIAELIENRFFDGLIFHRVIPGFMIQGGGMDEKLRQKTCNSIKGEFAANGVKNPLPHKKGTLSMARTQVPDSASSQFFICVADCAYLDGQYAAFGALCDDRSMAVAEAIAAAPTHSVGYYDDVPRTPIVIDTITVTER